MNQLYSEDNEQLQSLWKEYNSNEDEYLQEENVIKWIKASLQKTNALENFQSSQTDLTGLIKTYLKEVHQVSSQKLKNIKLSYSQSVDFLRWLTSDEQKVEKQDEKEEKQEKQASQREQQPQLHQQTLKNSAVILNKSNHQQPLHQQEVKQSPKSMKNSMVQSQKKLALQQIQQYLKQKNSPKRKTEQIEQKESLQEANEINSSSANQLNLQQLSKKYKDYLKIIFEHYCKISYATGQDPTFQQIKHKTTVMTINKFMIFCKDFEIAKISEVFNRSYLIQIFKKNSECYKEMFFEQFCDVIKKIACVAYSTAKPNEQKKDKNDNQTLTEEMVKILQCFQIQNASKFKQKMKKLNIQYRVGPKTKAQLKVIPDGYRFKFTSNNGKSEDQIKLEIQERKQHRSERKIMLLQRANNLNNQASFRKRVKSKNNTSIYEKQEKVMREINRQPNSTYSANKILTPPVPPPKKLSYLPPNPPKASSNYPPSISSQSNAISNSNTNIFKKDLSYAQMHKLKQNEGNSRKLGVHKSSSKQGSRNFKLNSIVQQARFQVQQMSQVHPEIYSDNLTESIATNSREESVRARNYDLNKINNKIQIINERNKRDRQIKEQLESLIDMSNDEDEFLKQHLQRQKKNDTIGKRLSQRINQLQKLK